MRSRTSAILGLVLGLALLWAGCCRPQSGGPCTFEGGRHGRFTATGKSCTQDTDCQTGFCDLGICAVQDTEELGYGHWCKSGLPPYSADECRFPVTQGEVCFGYICRDQRCRSCQSDAECQAGSSDYKCIYYYKFDGKRCGDPNAELYNPGANRVGRFSPSDPDPNEGIPMVSRPPFIPNTKPPSPPPIAVGEGAACPKDRESCESDLCDRGTCAEDKASWAWGYGDPCYSGPPHALEDPRAAANGANRCGGYVCVNGRCSSCLSDAECQAGSSDYTCLSYEGLPGRRCANPKDALRSPRLPQPRR